LVDLKVAVHRHHAILDEKSEDLKVRLGIYDSENQMLSVDNKTKEQFINSNKNVKEVTAANVDSLVYPSNPVSKKMLEL
jgi:hypothetical protein